MEAMNEMEDTSKTFLQLGKRLKQLRQRRKASITDVSGAVEIEAKQLEEIEKGQTRPSEDILLLLASYFELKDSEAAKLWDLAGYSPKESAMPNSIHDMLPEAAKAAMLILPVDNRVVYSDMVHVSANQYGVVLSFLQRATGEGQPSTVSRVGMSKEHAKSVLELLQKTLYQMEPKGLPGSRNSKKQK